jgi:hypothetical protein
VSANPEDTSRLVQLVTEALHSDLVSAGVFGQIIADAFPGGSVGSEFSSIVLAAVLNDVEIGNAVSVDDGYVKFIAWRGSVASRCERAIRQAQAATESERAFAYWLCLKQNVDEYE